MVIGICPITGIIRQVGKITFIVLVDVLISVSGLEANVPHNYCVFENCYFSDVTVLDDTIIKLNLERIGINEEYPRLF